VAGAVTTGASLLLELLILKVLTLVLLPSTPEPSAPFPVPGTLPTRSSTDVVMTIVLLALASTGV